MKDHNDALLNFMKAQKQKRAMIRQFIENADKTQACHAVKNQESEDFPPMDFILRISRDLEDHTNRQFIQWLLEDNIINVQHGLLVATMVQDSQLMSNMWLQGASFNREEFGEMVDMFGNASLYSISELKETMPEFLKQQALHQGFMDLHQQLTPPHGHESCKRKTKI